MSDQPLKIAVFIDFDNVEIGVKTTLGLHFDVGAVLEAIKERGEIITKVAYSDWKRSGDHGRAMANYAVRLVQRVMTPGGDKNGADINLALDALEMAFTHDHINAFVIVGGDSDFITLVEKLKQYDKKVFVVGGRSFTSQVMQKNCTEFIAYENIAPDRRGSAASQPRSERGRGPATSLDHAMPLVSRALQVLTDREVTPQLGLLKSTLLQLDSSFSERDYGVSSFRDFAERLAQRGFVTLRHNGRSTLVELADGAPAAPAAEAPADGETPAAPAAESTPPREMAVTPAPNVADGVEILRRVLADPPTPPRWPMYLRQMKQFLRTAEPEFDERKHGSIVDVMRAGQKDGLVRLERDRQGGLRVFSNQPAAPPAAAPPPSSGQVYQPKKVTVGWTLGQDVEDAVEVQEDAVEAAAASPADAVVTEAPAADAPADAQPALALDAPAATPVVVVDAAVEDEEPQDSQTNFFGPEGIIETPIPGAPRRQRRTRKTAAAAPASEAKPKRARKTAGTARKTTAAPRTRRKTTEK